MTGALLATAIALGWSGLALAVGLCLGRLFRGSGR